MLTIYTDSTTSSKNEILFKTYVIQQIMVLQYYLFFDNRAAVFSNNKTNNT